MDSKYIKWSTLAFMAFSTVWGFGNVVNGFVYFKMVLFTLTVSRSFSAGSSCSLYILSPTLSWSVNLVPHSRNPAEESVPGS